MNIAPDSGNRPRRRLLLQAAAGAPIAATAVTAGQGTASATTSPRVDPHRPRFTLAVLPDTQYLIDEGGSDHEPVREALRYLLRTRHESNIVFLAHLGDVTEHGTEAEMRDADRVFATIDRRLPYSVLAGNHDVDSGDDQRGDSPYLETFGPHRFTGMPTYGGSSPDGYNSYHRFEAGGREWLLLALDWRVSDAGIAWTQEVLDRFADLPTILTTHDLVWSDGDHAELTEHGQRLWERLIRRNDQIFLALGGHNWPPGRLTRTNDAGNVVHLHLTNYQDRYYGGAGMIRLYAFDLVRNTIDVETFSPWLRSKGERRTPLEAENVELTGDVDRF
ncbi:MAG TPA: metallophosphoesterase, partial [Actinopolymorphaceae bacterium]